MHSVAPSPHKRDYLSINDISATELAAMLTSAVQLKQEHARGGNAPLLAGKTLAMLFTKPSLRTRVSFELAMKQLGGDALYVAPYEHQMGTRESVPDVARILSGYVDAIMARVHAHDDVVSLARHSRVSVINGLSDREHPCQALADMLTILETKGSVKGINITYVGDANNVSNSMLLAGAMLGAHMTIASPRGYEVSEDFLRQALAYAEPSGATITHMEDPRGGVEAADVIYTDSWVSMGLEAETAARLKVFPKYAVNAALVKLARPDAIVMHCLPAHRGQEITDDVADGVQSALWLQAENRLHAQKALLAKLLG